MAAPLTPNQPAYLPGDSYAADASLQHAYAGRYTNTGAPIITLAQFQSWFRVWANSTEVARQKMRRDYEFVEGNGKQWSKEDRQRVLKTGRPVLEFNQILPQVEFICGMQRDMQVDFKTAPRGFEDIRLGEISTASLKAAMDFNRVQRTSDKVFDDGTVSGLGVWEVLHSFDDADDLLWGDITVNRIHPQAFIYDPWSIQLDLQDGTFMGKATWMDIGEFRSRYPQFANLAVPGEWLSRVNQLIGSSDDLGTGPNLIPELWDQGTGRIRILTMWYKVPQDIVLMVDERTGEVKEFASKDEAAKHKAGIAQVAGTNATAPLQIITQGMTAGIVGQTGQPLANPQTGVPVEFANAEVAQAHLTAMGEQAGMEAIASLQVITRVAKRPHWAEMVYWQVLDQGPSPYKDRRYPYVPYIARRFADDPESIIGVVRNLQDPQEEYNKRYSNLLAHINSSSHSGWLNRKAGGANRLELELMGSKPGVVVEYAAEPPAQIKPVEMSQGHFTMLQVTSGNILRISSVNAEMIGNTTQQTVSGRAIAARQAGGATGLKPRLRSYEDSLLDLARMVFSRIQQYYPPEKIKRIIGVYEQNTPLGPGGMPLFTDPRTGQPVPEDQIIQYLSNVSNIEFDVAFATHPSTPTEREAQFQTALQVAQLVTQSGRPIGPATFTELINMSDMPSRLATALKVDAMMPPQQPADPAGQSKQLQQMTQGKGRGGESNPGSGGPGNNESTPNKSVAAQQRPDVGQA